MDASKKAKFVSKMGKNVKRKRLSKGGLIKKIGDRAYFDDGGTVLAGPGGVGYNGSPTVNNHGLVGTVNDLLGMNNNFQAQGVNIQQGTNAAQLNAAYQGAQGGLGQQQDFTNQLGAQGAQGMQSQLGLTGQLQGVINGTGPNPAQAALAQNTGQNIAAQNALMAGQRGAGANAGLIARQAAMQGAGIQQNAVGQAATMQAQQQIAAQQQLQQLAQSQIGQQAGAIQGVNQMQQNEQNILQGANSAANNAAVTMQSNINATNAAVAAANQQSAIGTGGKLLSGISSAAAAMAHGGEVPHMASGGPLMVNQTAQPMMQAPWVSSTPVGGGSASAGPAVDMPKIDMGSEKGASDFGSQVGKQLGPQIHDMFSGDKTANIDSSTGAPMGAGEFGPEMAPAMAHGGEIPYHHFDSHFQTYFSGGETEKVPAMVSPGEIYLSPQNVHKVIHEDANPMKIGEKIKGSARVKGDSLKNDTVPKTLEEGGVVIPRHIATHKMAADKAALFVHKAVARKKARG